jgi:hypothetical protein
MLSREDTKRHIKRVNELIETFIGIGVNSYTFEISQVAIKELFKRGREHDASKLEAPELKIFDKYTTKLKKLTYQSDAYKRCLREMKPALQHHYKHNRHHPEHFNHISEMHWVDLVEMFCDWLAASERHENGDASKSIILNADRFHFGYIGVCILHNSLAVMRHPELAQLVKGTLWELYEHQDDIPVIFKDTRR